MNLSELKIIIKGKLVRYTKSDDARFWSRVNKNGPLPDQLNPHYAGLDKCWEWTSVSTKDGYGTFRFGGIRMRANRLLIIMTTGCSLPDSEIVCHRCDNPSCVNPSHLFKGTHQSNAEDKEAKGRGNQPRGEAHYLKKNPEKIRRGDAAAIKLTSEIVREMRRLYDAGGTSTLKLAAKYNISKSNAWNIVNHRNWKMLNDSTDTNLHAIIQ